MQPPAWCAKYVGVPYREYGRGIDGADCWGLARMIWRDRAGIELPEHGDVNPDAGADCATRMREYLSPWLAVMRGAERELDGVMMTGCYGSGRQVRRAEMHVGVVVAPGWLIHTDKPLQSACMVRYRDVRFGHDITGFWRHVSLV